MMTALDRLTAIRVFLERLNRRFPEGIPLEYAAAIRAELAPLVEDAQLEIIEGELRAELLSLSLSDLLAATERH